MYVSSPKVSKISRSQHIRDTHLKIGSRPADAEGTAAKLKGANISTFGGNISPKTDNEMLTISMTTSFYHMCLIGDHITQSIRHQLKHLIVIKYAVYCWLCYVKFKKKTI